MRRLLLVDDDAPVLNALKKAMRPWRDTWDVELAEGGRSALAALEAGPFDAVVADARMPDVDGEAVLDFARTRQPTTVRLVLSGQVDARTGHRLAGVAHQFLSKPSSGASVLAAIEECCRLRDTLENPRVREAVASLGTLPVGPRVYHRITALIDSATASIDEIAGLIEHDVGLSTSLLRFVSSAFFGLSRPVSSLKQACSLIGLENVRELVLVAEVFSAPDPLGLTAELQRRGIQRARLARLISEGSPMATLAGEAALLSEVGSWVLSLPQPAVYRPLWSKAQAGEACIEDLERAAFGCDHAQVGAALLGLWALPQTVVNAVAWHHEPPAEVAELDTRTVLALTSGLEREALAPKLEPSSEIEALTHQLGLSARLTTFRQMARQVFREEETP